MDKNAFRLKKFHPLTEILVFLIPAAVFVVFFYFVTPLFETMGLNPYYAYLLSLGIPLFLLGISAIIGYMLEIRSFSLKGILKRFRFHPIRGKDWLVLAVVFAVEMVFFILFNYINLKLLESGNIPLPAGIPEAADPLGSTGLAFIESCVGTLKGNWTVFLITLIALIINVVGEEMWWRGYIYPRQIANRGKFVWIFHGLLWALFHSYKYWDMLILIPVCIGLSYAVYKTKNSSSGLVFHFITNGTAVISILAAVIWGT